MFGPSLNPLDAETVVGLEPQVGGGISAQYRRQVNWDELGSTRLAINDPVARELGAATVRRIAQAATGSDQIPHRHADFERIRSGNVGMSVDTHHLVRVPDVGLKAQVIEQRPDDSVAARLQIEDHDAIERHQRHVRG